MSIVVKSVLCAGLFELLPSKTRCMRLVSRVFVQCSGRNPCCVGAMGKSGRYKAFCVFGWRAE